MNEQVSNSRSTDVERDVLDSQQASRRDAMKAVAKYAVAFGASATVIVSAEDALAQQACSFFENGPGNGNGNGPPPGRGPRRCR